MIHNENKQAIAVYMKWRYWPGGYGQCYRVTEPWGKTVLINFDSNDASLCVAEMQKRGDWEYFVGDTEDTLIYTRYHKEHHSYKSFLIAWLFNAENFFEALAEWLREGK